MARFQLSRFDQVTAVRVLVTSLVNRLGDSCMSSSTWIRAQDRLAHVAIAFASRSKARLKGKKKGHIVTITKEHN